ncbi:hypothetical protein [Vibrio crassostreae]|jgi:hypothetical protein|uniref:hypothetical protein n=1 Tax=Vibrio crassostreae TaxID=246167 RepID=UPI001B30FDD2|nr:hypothetical protein [Vibrio crassostreae]
MVSRTHVNKILLAVGAFEVSQNEWNVLMRLGSDGLNEVSACKAILDHRSVSMDVRESILNLSAQFQLG